MHFFGDLVTLGLHFGLDLFQNVLHCRDLVDDTLFEALCFLCRRLDVSAFLLEPPVISL